MPEKRPPSAKTVLVVEDDKFLRRVYESKLVREGFTILTAANGLEGIKQFREGKPDAVLLDLVMAKKTGFDVLDEIGKDPLLKQRGTPVIVLSNLGQESDVRRAMTLGATDYLIKSNTPINAIVDRLRRALARNVRAAGA